MTDQAPVASNAEASLSPEVADYFGVNQATPASTEKVTSDGTENKTAVADTTKENVSDSKTNDVKKSDNTVSTDDKKTTATENKAGEDSKDKKTAQPAEIEVAGTKYATIEEAVKAVNRINGDNTRLSGETKSLRKEKTELQSKVESLEKLLSDYKKANEEWQKYYEDGGEKPDNTKVDIEELIDKKVKDIKAQESKIAQTERFNAELDEVFADPEFETVKPFFQELVDEYDGVPKVSPKKLYERAKVLSKKDVLKESLDIDKMIEERAEKKLAQKEAAKAATVSGGSTKPSDAFEGMSPEVAEYFKQRI